MFKICHGISCCEPQNQMTHRQTIDGFVDCVTCWFSLGLLHSLLNRESVQDIASGLEREGQARERLLWTVGSKLEFSKCLY